MRTIFLTILYLFLTSTAHAYTKTPVPDHLQTCVNEAIATLAVSDGSRKSVEALFKKYVDRDRLGQMVWGRAWSSGSETWRTTAISMYIDTLTSRSSATKRSANVTSIDSRLADQPERGVNRGKGLWHIVFAVELSDRRTVTAAALITDACKVVELAQGIWIGRTISASDVDARLRK